MATWTAFCYSDEYPFDARSVRKNWGRLHAGDLEPLPEDARVVAAWVLFHRGEFQQAVELAQQAGPAGVNVANKATCVYASYLEPKERVRLRLFQEVSDRAAAFAKDTPDNANAFFWQAYALSHYCQGISVAKALAQGLGGRVKSLLEKTIALQPEHADALVALGAFHAEVIDKVGTLIASMTYGAKKETSLALFERALRLTPQSARARTEYANALVILEGERRNEEATRHYEQAAQLTPLDANERLEVQLALTELAQ